MKDMNLIEILLDTDLDGKGLHENVVHFVGHVKSIKYDVHKKRISTKQAYDEIIKLVGMR